MEGRSYDIYRTEICLVRNGVLLILSIVINHFFQVALIERGCSVFRSTVIQISFSDQLSVEGIQRHPNLAITL